MRILIGMCACWAVSFAPLAQETLITLGKHEAHPTRILAKLKEGVTLQSSQDTLRELGLTTRRQYSLVPGLILLDSSPVSRQAAATVPVSPKDQLLARIAALRDSGLLEFVQADYVHRPDLTPNDSRFADGTLWGLSNSGQNGGKIGADVQAVQAWDLTTGSTNVVVAVIDTGIRYTHRDLRFQMWENPTETPGNGIDDDNNGFVDDVHGINAIIDNGDPMDDQGHGSHVSGTIGAEANNGFPHVGVAWNVRLMGLKFLRSDAQGGYGVTSDAIQCLNYAVVKGAKISNNSWGGGPFEPALRAALVAARNQGHLFVAAAGNSALDNDLDPHFPSSYDVDNVISVAALDRKDALAYFSNYGNTSVDLGAPGVEIFSCWMDSDTDYNTIDGTSMASPHVAGVAALCLARYPTSTLSEMRERLLSTTIPVAALAGKSVTGGRVSAYQALQAAADGILEVTVDPPGGSDILVGTRISMFVRVNDLVPVTNATFANITLNGAATTNLAFRNDGQAPDVVTNDNVYSSYFNVPTNEGPIVITFEIRAAGKTTSTNVVTYNGVGRPANDNFTNAFKVASSGGIVQGRNNYATLEFREPLHAQVPTVNGSVWWNWSPLSDTDVVVDTTGSSFDTVLAVYVGDAVSALKQVAAVDDVGNRRQGYVYFSATNGVTYHIAVSGYDTNEFGSVQLRVEPGGRADTVPPVVVVDSPSSGWATTTNRITIAGTATDPQPSASQVSEVFVQVNTGLAQPATGTINWSSPVTLIEGRNTIQVYAVDFAGNSSVPAVITVYYIVQDPPNDFLVNAIALTGNQGAVSGNNVRGTKEAGEPFHAGNQGGKSVWWYWQAPGDGVLDLHTAGSSFDTMLAMYTGTRVTNLVYVAANDDGSPAVTFSVIKVGVRASEIYRIAVDGFGGASGQVALSYRFTPSAVYRLTVNAGPGGSATPPSGDYAAGRTLLLQATPDYGFEFVGWQGTVISTDNPLSITIDSDMTLTANFRTQSFTDGFETGDFTALPWTAGGNLPWLVQTNEVAIGRFAARSGSITDGQTSSLLLTRVTPEGIGSFDVRVSSEFVWDKLEFRLNGSLKQSWSGDVAWQSIQFAVPAGTNTFEWRYLKDQTISLGLDAAFIDNVDLPAIATEMQLLQFGSAGSRLRLRGQSGHPYVIQASSDLLNWQPISTNVAVNGIIEINDSAAAGKTSRFYRAVRPLPPE